MTKPSPEVRVAVERIRRQLEALPGHTAYTLTVIDLECQHDMTASNIPIELQAAIHQDLADRIRQQTAKQAN